MSIDQQLLDALTDLWHIPPPRPKNLFSAPAFTALGELCAQRYGGNRAVFALHNALRSLGLPCEQPENLQVPALDLPSIAAMLVNAYSRKTTVRRYICPLDLADDLPSIVFGTARIAQFNANELEQLFDNPRLVRHFPTLPLDSKSLARFHWLIVEDEITLDSSPEIRACPFLSMDMSQDFGEIEPHLGRFPKAVEEALFFLLLAPWENWSTLLQVDWRGFRIPWIYTVDEDLFVAPSQPPSQDSLSLEPWIIQDAWGEEIELERPTVLPLKSNAFTELKWVTNINWTKWQAASTTSLFETPVVHFLVRAFLTDGVDEFIAHLTVIEAAFGSRNDYKTKRSATKCVAAKLSAALDDDKAGQEYEKLFNLRSQFIHGRAEVSCISTDQRVSARSLARRAACALIRLALASCPEQPTRELCLSSLLDKGVKPRASQEIF